MRQVQLVKVIKNKIPEGNVSICLNGVHDGWLMLPDEMIQVMSLPEDYLLVEKADSFINDIVQLSSDKICESLESSISNKDSGNNYPFVDPFDIPSEVTPHVSLFMNEDNRIPDGYTRVEYAITEPIEDNSVKPKYRRIELNKLDSDGKYPYKNKKHDLTQEQRESKRKSDRDYKERKKLNKSNTIVIANEVNESPNTNHTTPKSIFPCDFGYYQLTKVMASELPCIRVEAVQKNSKNIRRELTIDIEKNKIKGNIDWSGLDKGTHSVLIEKLIENIKNELKDELNHVN